MEKTAYTVFPENYNLGLFKAKVNRHFLDNAYPIKVFIQANYFFSSGILLGMYKITYG